MSEYQYVAFRAIDAPVSEKNLAYMRRQSSRAEITAWSFDNEYNFGDFHGNSHEMMRRGYDFFVHYANFGVRAMMIRFPNGLPVVAKPYLQKGSLEFQKDKKGPAGTLCIEPYFEPGDVEEIWEIQDTIARLLPLRAEIVDGDVRPLFLARLAVAGDLNHDRVEPLDVPIPAGLGQVTAAQSALAEFFGVGADLIAAAARDSPPAPGRAEAQNAFEDWVAAQPVSAKDAWLARLMSDPQSNVRSELLAQFRKARPNATWPTVSVSRSFNELDQLAETIQQDEDRRKAAAAEAKRARQLKKMSADPSATVRKIEKLVAERSLDAYAKAAALLADLRDALMGTNQSSLADSQALKLKQTNPHACNLFSALRAKGFFPKKK